MLKQSQNKTKKLPYFFIKMLIFLCVVAASFGISYAFFSSSISGAQTNVNFGVMKLSETSTLSLLVDDVDASGVTVVPGCTLKIAGTIKLDSTSTIGAIVRIKPKIEVSGGYLTSEDIAQFKNDFSLLLTGNGDWLANPNTNAGDDCLYFNGKFVPSRNAGDAENVVEQYSFNREMELGLFDYSDRWQNANVKIKIDIQALQYDHVVTGDYTIENISNADAWIVFECVPVEGIVIDSVTSDYYKTVSVKGASDYTGTSIEIPELIWEDSNGALYGVTERYKNRFLQDENVYSVTGLANNAFNGFSNLESVSIPSGVTSIGSSAFCGCTALTSIEIPSGVTSIGQMVFSGCTSLNNITIPSGITSISPYIFRDCTSLTNIFMLEGVTSIGEYAFSGCTSLTSISIPNTIITIGGNAFSGCISLTNITIPASVTSMGNTAFGGCTNLTIYCEIADPSPNVPTGWNSNWNPSNCPVVWGYVPLTPENYFNFDKGSGTIWGLSDAGYFANITKLNIPSTIEGVPVTRIGNYAFNANSNITSVNIPASVTSIEELSFHWIDNLETVTFASGSQLQSIGDEAFSDCSSLSCNIIIPRGVISIGKSAFSGTDITGVTFESGSQLQSIGNSAFYNCTSLGSITLPSGLTSIGNSAFEYCSSLTNDITLPSTVTSIGEYAFNSCSMLRGIIIPSGVTSMGYAVFRSCYELTIYCEAESQPATWESSWNPDNNQVIWDYTPPTPVEWFNYDSATHTITGLSTAGQNANPTKIAIPSSINSSTVNKIGASAFSGCTSLTSVKLPEHLTTIGASAFSGCTSLTSIIIPSSVAIVGSNAFDNCNSLTIKCEAFNKPAGWESNWNPDNRPEIWDYMPTTPESYFNFDENSGEICGVTSEADGIRNLVIPSTIRGITVTSISSLGYKVRYVNVVKIPTTVTSIARSLFSSYTKLNRVVFESGSQLQSIGDDAFSNCISLQSITLPSGLVSIGEIAFSNCISLQSITLPSGLVSIGESAFSGCSSLTSINLPSSLTSIGDCAFSGCNLSSVVIPSSVTDMYDITFGISTQVYCLATSKPSGWSGDGWGYATNVYWYRATQPSESGHYWHYVDDVPTAWPPVY